MRKATILSNGRNILVIFYKVTMLQEALHDELSHLGGKGFFATNNTNERE